VSARSRLSALLFGVLLYARLEYRRSTAIGLIGIAGTGDRSSS
jgi:hypothetical protein